MIRLARIAIGVLVASSLAGTASSAPSDPLNFPYDPACNWGRISNGRGMFLRCLTQTEATQIQSTPQTTPKEAAPAAAAPSTGQAPQTPEPEFLTSELVEVKAEEGDLPLARKKLALPLDRYAECVRTNGGLKGATGLVTVQFLVRERGRAEGASVAKYQGVTETAARCVADIVDRRPTGTPEAPVVSASVTIRILRKSQR